MASSTLKYSPSNVINRQIRSSIPTPKPVSLTNKVVNNQVRKGLGISTTPISKSTVKSTPKASTNNTPSGAIKSGSVAGGGTSVDTGGGYYGDYSDNYIDYEAILRAQQEAEERRLAELRRRADEAYNRNMARIENTYNSTAGDLRNNYDSTVNRLNEARDKSTSDVNADAEKSLQEAYINNMMNRKNLNQRLSAMGYNGGATETTMGSLDNQYGASRNGINEAVTKSLANLNQTYGDNLAGALQSYNSAMSNLGLQRMQLENAAENARNNMEASFTPTTDNLLMNQDYVNALKNVVSRQGQYSFNPTQATNTFVAGNAQQAQNAAQGTNYAKLRAQAQLEAQQGKPINQIQQELFAEVNKGNLGIDSLYDILAQLGR